MKDIELRKENIPAKLEDLREFILVGKQVLKAHRAKLRAIRQVGKAVAAHQAALSDGQDIADVVLDAEIRMGALLAVTVRQGRPKKGSTTGTFLPEGVTKKQSHEAQQLNRHPALVRRCKAQARKNGELVTSRTVLEELQRQVRADRENKREAKRRANAEKAARCSKDIFKSGVKFATILVDPPWDWADEGDVNQLGRGKHDYHAMSKEELLALPVGNLADDDCHIYVWVTNRSIPKGPELLVAWGFRYITMLTWPKPSFGMGNYFRGQTEHVLFGLKGSQSLRRKDASTLLPAWSRGVGHSTKPTEFHDFVESCSPGPYVELFGRSQREGWSVWGADADG